MEENFTQRSIFKLLMFLALICGLIFFYTDHFDFIITALQTSKFNVPNIGYVFLRFFGILLPLTFIVPSFFEFGRIKLARIFFIIYGFFHLVTISWAVYFLAGNSYADIFSAEKVADFLQKSGFVYSQVFWDNTGFISLILAFIYGLAAIYTGIQFDKDKSRVKTLVCVLLTLRIALPLLSNIFTEGRIFSEYWISVNLFELICQFAFTVAIVYAGSNNFAWIELVWDQLAFSENDEAGQNDQFDD